MAAPKLPDSERRDIRVQVRITPQEATRLDRLRARRAMTRSDYIRQLLTRAR